MPRPSWNAPLLGSQAMSPAAATTGPAGRERVAATDRDRTNGRGATLARPAGAAEIRWRPGRVRRPAPTVAGGRVLPVLLAAERRQVEERPDAAERLDAAVRREVGAKDVVAVSQEDAEPERLAVLVDVRLRRLRTDAEVDVEVALERREPRDRPPHPLPVRLDPGERGARHEREGRVAGVQVREVADLVDEHRAAVAARVLVRPEHEVVEEQLTASLEEVGQARLSVRAVEDVVLVDPDSRQPAALGGERVACPGGFLFLGKKRVVRCLPVRG